MAADTETCRATTKTGARCRNRTRAGRYCARHAHLADDAPADLDGEARTLWRDTKAWLERERAWDPIKEKLLERYVRADARARMGRDAARDQPWVTGSTGQTVPHPGIRIERQAERDLHDYAEALGLLDDANAKPPDPDDEAGPDEFEGGPNG